MARFEIGKSYGARDKRMGAVKVLGRIGNRIRVQTGIGKTEGMTVFLDRNGDEAIGSKKTWMWQYSAAITARV